MNSLSIYHAPNHLLLFKARLAERLDDFKNKVSRWLIKDIINDFDKINQYYIAEFNDSDSFTISVASLKLNQLAKTLKLLQRLDNIITHINSLELKKNFRLLKKSVYRFEARLHRISVSETPVIETPNELKAQISNMGMSSINKKMSPNNAIS